MTGIYFIYFLSGRDDTSATAAPRVTDVYRMPGIAYWRLRARAFRCASAYALGRRRYEMSISLYDGGRLARIIGEERALTPAPDDASMRREAAMSLRASPRLLMMIYFSSCRPPEKRDDESRRFSPPLLINEAIYFISRRRVKDYRQSAAASRARRGF